MVSTSWWFAWRLEQYQWLGIIRLGQFGLGQFGLGQFRLGIIRLG
ncbi:MAG: hypothetical protein AAF067_12965 [Pseudomonadota bacterium]